MKSFKSLFATIVMLISLSTSFAQNYGKIYSFEVLPESLVGNKIRLNIGSSSTTVKYKVVFERTLSSPGNWHPIQMEVGLSSYNSSYNTFLFSQTNNQISSSIFPDNNSAFSSEVILTTVIDHSKIWSPSQKILLGYKSPDLPAGAIAAYNYKEYETEKVVPPPGPQPPAPTTDRIPIYALTNNSGYARRLSTYIPTGNLSPGIAFYAFNTQVPGTVPIYQFDGINSSPSWLQYDFLYSTSNQQGSYWKYNSIKFYAFATQEPGTVPVYCYTNQQNKDWFFHTGIETHSYWKHWGIVFYVYPTP